MGIGKYDFKAVEEEIQQFWDNNNIYQKAKEKNNGKRHFYFLDGPPYTSGKVHIGTAWNKTLKDIVLRFKRMQGFNVWDRAGYDMHGMPIAQAVQREQGLKDKEAIKEYGIQNFIEKCKEFALKNMKEMNKDFHRLGVWMDFENAYMPITKEYIEGEWWLIKKAHENDRLYQGEKTMTWCAECGTSLAKHELEYQNVSDNSIFLKFKILGTEKEYLVIWTTTPWTIPFNLGVMANPSLDYVKVKVENEEWILAKALAGIFINGLLGKEFKILDEFKGKKLEGLKYIHPLKDELHDLYEKFEEKSEKVHSVVMSEEYVNTTAGSGLVHMAPGCGPEDYEVGHREGIPPLNELDEQGVFKDSMKKFSGWRAKKDDKKFIEEFKENGSLIKTTQIDHDYAHCWRCKQPVVYRTTKQWFFRIEDLKQNMRELNKEIKWVPGFAGSKNFDSWLDNLRDNGITRQRFWGTPLPIWKCKDCGSIKVIGSIEELKELAGEVPEDLHKPWIDKIKFGCDCGSEMIREPDILDVWVDAGTASWNSLGYPKEKELFNKLFPADFILEGIDQIRGWFNLLFVASMISMKKPSFKNVYMHGFVQDSQGRKMSKSLGNYILPQEVIDKYGADTFRYYASGAANPGVDLNYNFEDMKIKFRNLGVLWNLHNFLIELSKEIKKNPFKIELKNIGIEERYILSILGSTIKKATQKLKEYKINEIESVIESLFLNLSRSYIQFVREKSSTGSQEEKEIVAATIGKVLIECIKMFSIICPFISEKIFQNLKTEIGLEEESIHLTDWPSVEPGLIDSNLEKEMDSALSVIQTILRCREKSQLGIRWPVKKVSIVTGNSKTKKSVGSLKEIIMTQTNVKEIEVMEKHPEIKIIVKPNHSTLGAEFGELVPKIIAKFIGLSFNDILDEIEKKDSYHLDIEKKKVEIQKKHLIIEREYPEDLVEAEFNHGQVYLDTTRTKSLDGEGFSRELMRRVQSLRKKEGLNKNDKINLFVKADENLANFFDDWKDKIKNKVGAEKIDISNEDPNKDYNSKSNEKVKGEIFDIYFNKV